MDITIIEIEKYLNKLLNLYGCEFSPQIATNDEISKYQIQHNIVFTPELVEWLTYYNGLFLNNGIIQVFGINQENIALEISACINDYKEHGWIEKRWIPISTDGCGNFYVLDGRVTINNKHPVYLVDICDYTKPSHIVASSLNHFLLFIINNEIIFHEKGIAGKWTYDKQYVINMDPDIVLCTTAPQPWE